MKDNYIKLMFLKKLSYSPGSLYIKSINIKRSKLDTWVGGLAARRILDLSLLQSLPHPPHSLLLILGWIEGEPVHELGTP